MQDTGERHALVFAHQMVVADAKNGELLRHGDAVGAAGGQRYGGVGVVVAEKGERTRRGAEFLRKPAQNGARIVPALRIEVFRQHPAEDVGDAASRPRHAAESRIPRRWSRGDARPRFAEAHEAVRVDRRPLGGEPGGVAVVALDQMLGGKATDGAVVAADAGEFDFGMLGGEIHDGDASAAESANEFEKLRFVAQRDKGAVAAPPKRRPGRPPKIGTPD